MRITIAQGAFLPVPPVRGGAVEKIWHALGQEFARRGHEVTHLSRALPPLPPEEQIGGVRHLRLPGYDTPASLPWLKALDLIYSLRVLRALPPADVVVTHTFWLPWLLRSKRAGKLYVHVARAPRGQMRFYRHAARLQTVSHPIAQAIADEIPDRRDLVKVIPNPLPEADFHTPAPPAPGGPFTFLYTGRIHPEKGVHVLVEAFNRLPSEVGRRCRLVIVGPAETSAGGGGEAYRRKLAELAGPGHDRIEWTGPIYDSARLAEQYRRASVFVYPSLAERGESFGLAPLEAMSHGCPALVSSLACFQDFIAPDRNGFVFDHRVAEPAQTLSAQMAALAGANGHLTAARGAARATAERYSVTAIADQYLADFASLLA